jgi:hypothetical protein
MSDAFRRAMRDLGATAPEPPDGLGPAARQRARGIVRRRVTVVSLSGAAALGIVAALLLVPSGGSQRLVSADDPTPTITATTPDVTESPTPSTSPSTSPSPSASAPRIGPPPSPETDTGPTVELRLVKAAPTGEESVLEVHVVDPYGGLAALNLSFGVKDPAHVDQGGRFFYGAGSVFYGPGEIDASRNDCPDLASGPTDTRLLFRRRFRIPGEYTAWVKVQTRSCDGHPDMEPLHGRWVASDTLRYAVTGRLWPNGPNQPTATLAFRRSHFKDGSTADDGPGVQIVAADDGDVRDVTVDWGDGTVESVPYQPAYAYGAYNDCEHPEEFFANGTQGVEAQPDHTYAQPGTYTVTVTVTTASCDGTDRQSTTTSGTWDWPPPSASPSPDF